MSSPARAPGQAKGKARAASTTAPQPWQTNSGERLSPGHVSAAAAPLSALNSSIIASQAGARSRSPSQKDCLRAGREILERHALLLDPGEVAEVEDPLAVDMAELEHMVDAGARHRTPPGLAGADRVEAVAEIARRRLAHFAAIHFRAVGRDREHDVVGAEIEIFRQLHRGDDVADAGDAEGAEPGDQSGIDAAPLDEVLAALVGVEERQQRVGRVIADADDDVGVHDVVDQRHVLVADALDVVLAEAVHEQGRAFDRLDRRDPRAERALQMVAGRDRSRRAGRRDESGEPCARAALGHAHERPARAPRRCTGDGRGSCRIRRTG